MPDPDATRPPNLTTIGAVARTYGVSERTVRRRIADGELRAWRLGPRLLRVDADDAAAMLAPIPTAGGAA